MSESLENSLPALPAAIVAAAVERALAEDLAGGDLTTEATVPAALEARAVALAVKPLVACGGAVARAVFAAVDPAVGFTLEVADGTEVEAGARLFVVEGKARSLLMAERTALNFIQRMSGIATLTRRFVRALPTGSHTRITDTRKTTPGLRAFERYAVRCGGGHNHRNDLGSAVLIKDNHIAAAGSVRLSVERARAYAPHTSKIEVEVESFAELEQALAARADVILLDNFAPADVARAVASIAGRALVEVSGNVTLERVSSLAQAQVDVISSGALTHSAPAADISLAIEPRP
jgi:nicotinate-nucleotide pyrophosphorylase (carboxylating)